MTSLLKKIRVFQKSRSGTAAMEFALVAPVLFLLIIGSSALFDYVQAKNRVTQASDAVSDLTARALVMNDDEFEKIFEAATLVLGKYGVEGEMEGVITGYERHNDGKRWRSLWSEGYNTSEKKKNDFKDLDYFPTGHNKDMVVMVEMTLTYAVPTFFMGKVTKEYKEISVRVPRYTPKIRYPGNEDDDDDDDDD